MHTNLLLRTVSAFSLRVTKEHVMVWKHFSHYRPMVSEIHRWPINSPHKGQWYGVMMFSSLLAWTTCWKKQFRCRWSANHCTRMTSLRYGKILTIKYIHGFAVKMISECIHILSGLLKFVATKNYDEGKYMLYFIMIYLKNDVHIWQVSL